MVRKVKNEIAREKEAVQRRLKARRAQQVARDEYKRLCSLGESERVLKIGEE